MFAKGNGGRPLSVRVNLGVGVCLRCGSEFERHDAQQVWCSPKCRSGGNNARARAIPWKRRLRNKRERMRAKAPGPSRDRMLARKREWNRTHKEYLKEYSRARWARRRAAGVDAVPAHKLQTGDSR